MENHHRAVQKHRQEMVDPTLRPTDLIHRHQSAAVPTPQGPGETDHTPRDTDQQRLEISLDRTLQAGIEYKRHNKEILLSQVYTFVLDLRYPASA